MLVNSTFYARVAQLVEHDLAKVGVAGSSPVSRSSQKVNIIFIMREWLSWWSTTLPRSGSRVRVPSRALLNSKKHICIRCVFFFTETRPRSRVRIYAPLRSALTKVLWTFSFSVPLRSVLTKVHWTFSFSVPLRSALAKVLWTFSAPSHALLIHKRYPWGALHKEGAPRWRIARQTAFRWRCPHRFAARSLGII